VQIKGSYFHTKILNGDLQNLSRELQASPRDVEFKRCNRTTERNALKRGEKVVEEREFPIIREPHGAQLGGCQEHRVGLNCPQ